VGRHRIKLINQSDSARHTTREHLLFLIRSQQRGQKGWISPVHFPTCPLFHFRQVRPVPVNRVGSNPLGSPWIGRGRPVGRSRNAVDATSSIASG
jgi:hypothetical protein